MVDGNVLKRKLPVSNFLFTQVNISNSKYQMLYALANFQLENKKKLPHILYLKQVNLFTEMDKKTSK